MLGKLLKKHDTIQLCVLGVCQMVSTQDESKIFATDIDIIIQEAVRVGNRFTMDHVICKAQPSMGLAITYSV